MHDIVKSLLTKDNAANISKCIMASISVLLAGKFSISVFDQRTPNKSFNDYHYLRMSTELQHFLEDLFMILDDNGVQFNKKELLSYINQLLHYDCIIDDELQSLPVHANYSVACLQSKVMCLLEQLQNITYRIPSQHTVINEVCGELVTAINNIAYNVQQELNLLVI